jgi:hypothetical protein
MDLRTLRLPLFLFLVAIAGCGDSRSQASGEFGAVPGADGKSAPAAGTTPASANATPAAPAAGAPGGTSAATDKPKAINTRCPVTGAALGADAVTVTVTTEVILPPRTYVIACKDDAAAKKVSAEPNKYIPAALHNVEARHDSDPIDNPR